MKRSLSLLFCVLAVAACKTHHSDVSITEADKQFMREAIRLSVESVAHGGGPFGAVIDRIYYANTRQDAEEIDFDDNFIYEELSKPMSQRDIPFIQLLRDEAQAGFKAWTEKDDRKEY